MEAPTPTGVRLFDIGFVGPLFGIGLLSCLLVAWATQPHGPGVCPDGRTYLTSARLMTEGQGYSDYPHGDDWLAPQPVTQFPPLYPLTLALGRLLGLQDAQGARVLQWLLLFANVTLLGCFVASALNSRQAGWLAAALFAFAPAVVYVHLWVWSEPLCFFLILGCLLGLTRFEASQQRRFLALAMACCGLALLTRFAALSLLLTGCGLLLVGRGELRARLLNSAAFGTAGALVFIGWMIRNKLVAGEVTAFELHTALMKDELLVVLRMMSEWALPLPVWFGFKVLAFGIMLGLAGFAYLRAARTQAAQRTPGQRLAVLGGTLALVHFTFILAARRVVGTALETNDRILGPTLLGLILMAAGSVHGRWRYALGLWSLFWLAGSVIYGLAVHEDGLGYLGANWR